MMESDDQFRSFPYSAHEAVDGPGSVDQAPSLVDEVYGLFAETPELGLLAKKTGFANNGQIEDLAKIGPKAPVSAFRGSASKSSLFGASNSSRTQAHRGRGSDEGAAAVLSSLPSSPTKLSNSSSPAKTAALLAAAAAAVEASVSDDPSAKKRARRKKDDDLEDSVLPSVDDDLPPAKRRKASTSVASASGGRYGSAPEGTFSEEPRVGDKNKGLRLFSKVVCDKVMTKGVTSYNEVADELVLDYTQAAINEGTENPAVDQKNIRRRVYDALNVLMAMNIISKEKKEIKWIGLPPTSPRDELRTLTTERQQLTERIKRKQEQLHDLQAQHSLYSRLIKRNGASVQDDQERILVPFIIVHTGKHTHIDCDVSEDYTEYLMKFEHPFAIHDDIEILRRVLKTDESSTISTANRVKMETSPPDSSPSSQVKRRSSRRQVDDADE
eukprot:TRINITY_DN2460_c1_g1_i1.p2 TRINITY_DN2460_c1_g1~~TRINITY_DN2460_c1_g1_i1.p2  ORF type:complete len:441 (+),score=63.49 TRINITY_DN2460_c1_g1_i1:43-1365(+)